MSFRFNYSALGRFRHVILCAVSGVILALALPRPGLWILSWIALVPLFVALRDVRASRTALYGLVAGLVYCGIIFQWMALFGWLPWLLVTVYQGLYLAIFAILYTRLKPQRIGPIGFAAVPAAWVVLQFVRTFGHYACTWGSFAHTQANNLVIAQLASLTGPWGIDFLVCFVNIAIAGAVMGPRRTLRPIAVAGALVGAACAFGWVSLGASSPAPTHRVAVLQGNVIKGFERSFDYESRAYLTYSRLSTRAAESHPELILWPETAIPADIASPGWEDNVAPIAREAGCNLLAGGYDRPSDPLVENSYNALILFDKQGNRVGAYHKVRLVPFGEFVPLRNRLAFLKDYGIRPTDVLPARSHVILNSAIGKIGTSICFESIFPDVARNETARGAELLCVVTNDEWFGYTQAARQHVMMSRLRAIENRRFLLRAASTGISAVIDPYGRVRQELGLFREGIITDSVTPSKTLTLYTRLGDWLAFLCIGMTALCLFVPIRASLKSDREKPR